jgi:hypothetical protein
VTTSSTVLRRALDLLAGDQKVESATEQ